MIDDVWERLMQLRFTLSQAADRELVLSTMDISVTVFELYLPDVEEEMFLAAAIRMADRYGISVYRLDVPDGKPNLLLSFAVTDEVGRLRMEKFYIRAAAEREAGLDSIGE